jgi:hypothetical protein
MRKSILAPLCSALVVPGLGQILNQHLRKAGIILGGVFLLFVVASYKFVRIIQTAFHKLEESPLDSDTLVDRFQAEDLSALWGLLAVFAVLWGYSVVDAYRSGKILDQQAGKEAS